MAFFRSMAGRIFLLLLVGTTISAFSTLHLAMYRMWHPLLLSVIAICLLILAYVVSSITMAPLRELASAARRLGANIDTAPLPEHGPTEVREAAVAFNTMQARIQRDVRERTYMLAAITHDLQTPLTRLRLRLEKVQDEELREKLINDLASMRETVSEGLDLARSLDLHDPLQRIDLDSLLESLCADARDAGHNVTLLGGTHASVIGVPNALRRCVMNLLDNAIKYGTWAKVESRLVGKRAIVHIRDGGPGIPDDQQQAAFDPFFRIESSRSRETGGTGIGLTIARNIAERHGGSITLHNHAEGGLEVTIELPIASNG